MKNWIIILLIFALPIGLYAYLDAKAQSDMMCKFDGVKEVNNPIVKIIKFTSPMCSECQETTKELAKVKQTNPNDFVLEEINVLNNEKKGEDYTKTAIKKFKVTLVPTLVFINRDGKMIHRQEGLMRADEIVEVINGAK